MDHPIVFEIKLITLMVIERYSLTMFLKFYNYKKIKKLLIYQTSTHRICEVILPK